MNKPSLTLMAALLCSSGLQAAEVTIQNDSLSDLGQAVIVTGFIAGGGAGSWLTSPCDGNLRAVQVFWRSQSGTSGQIIHQAIDIYRSGSFPEPGMLAETIGGPVLTDGVINEYRFLDENSVIPLLVPVTQGETLVVALIFDTAPPSIVGPSVVRDVDGIEPQRNTIYSNFGSGFEWRSSESLGVTGDWVIRGVVDCQVVAQEADVAVGLSATPSAYVPGEPLDYSIVVNNAGPVAANGTTVVDIFPAAYTGVTWTCSSSGGASCTAAGSGNITQLVNLPAGGEVVFDVSGIVDPGSNADLVNTVTAVVAGGITDPDPDNNTDTLITPRQKQADVLAALSADPETYLPGQPLTLTAVISNSGPDAAANTSIDDDLPAAYSDVLWTCTATGGATCQSAGSDSIAQVVDLPSGSQLVFELIGTVDPGTSGALLAEVSAMVAKDVLDPDPDNNSAELMIKAGSDVIFADGFE